MELPINDKELKRLVWWTKHMMGEEELRAQIDEHAKMHELGIAHGHEGRRAYVTEAKKDYPKHKHD